MKTVALHPSDYLPGPPETKDYGIGFIGCGGIVIGSHLPAYENFGYNVVAACAIGQGRLRVAQERFGVPQVTQRIDDILENEEVRIIVFTPVARSSYRWQDYYDQRSAVERVNSRLAGGFGFERAGIRGLAKMRLRVTMALTIMLAMALGRIRAGQPEHLRSLIEPA